MSTGEIVRWRYKFVMSERFKTGVWYAVSENDVRIDPRPMSEVLDELGDEGWELIAVVPVGQTQLNHDQLLKHILKRPDL